MNIQEAKQELHNLAFPNLDTVPERLRLDDVMRIINQIDEPQKPKVSQVAVEFYEHYKADNLDLGEWFSDFYSKEAIEDFPRMEELAEWLHGNDKETNRQREFALATLVTLRIDAVEVEKEKLYIIPLKGLITTDGHQQYLTGKAGKYFASRRNYRLKQTFTQTEVNNNVPACYREFAEPVEEEL